MYRNNPLSKISWKDFTALDLSEKGKYFKKNERPYHTLIAQQFDRPILERLCNLATMIRKIGKTKGGIHFLQGLLSEKRAMLYFSQPSTRTFLSFYAACQIVGLQPAEVRDTSTSSEMKGESPEDSVRTFSSYFDIIIMRHHVGGFAERIAWLLSNTDRSIPAKISIRPNPCSIFIPCNVVLRNTVVLTANVLPLSEIWHVAVPFVRWPHC